MKLEDVIRASGARPLSPVAEQGGPEITGAAWDSREVKPGDLFVCIEGEKTDGHLHAAAAVKAGAAAVLARRDPFESEVSASLLLTPILLDDDPVKALGRLAHVWRSSFTGSVVGITGTAGKTTTREMLAHVLSLAGPTARSPRNLNTQVGLPVSMLAADGDERFWVMEAGISKAGDMDEIGSVLQPDLAVILNAGLGHTEGLGVRGAARHKAALLKYLDRDGMALVSADYDDLVRETRAVCPGAVFFSVRGKQLSYRASYLGLNGADQGVYRLFLDGLSLDVTCPLNGPYAAENVIAVAAAAHLLGLSADDIAAGLETVPLPEQRFRRLNVPGWIVLDDTYNANPLSCARMLEAAAELGRDRSLVCVMGEMRELGDVAEKEHIALGRRLAEAGAKAVLWLGGHADDVREGLEQVHFTGHFMPLHRQEDFFPTLAAWEQSRNDSKQGLILFKGSRSNRLEILVSDFVEQRSHHAV